MDFEFSEEQEELRLAVRRFLADQAPVAYVRGVYGDTSWRPDAVWRGLGGLGVLGLLAPEGRGGAGRGMVDAAVVLEELGRAVFPGPYLAHAVASVGLVDDLDGWGDHPAFAGLAAGEAQAALALYEPGRRATWRDPAASAVRDGDGWRVEGTKVHVDGAGSADVVLVACRADEGLGVFAVDAGEALIEAHPTVDGSHAEATVTLDGARARRVGPGDATTAVAATVDRVLAGAVVDGVGAAQQALEMSVQYAKERRQFGAPIGSFQAVQHLCADMLRATEMARAAGYYACWAADDADGPERHRAATMAIAFAADELAAVGAAAIQVHAGVGFTWEHDVHLVYKRLLTLQRTGGGSLDQLEELAQVALNGVGER